METQNQQTHSYGALEKSKASGSQLRFAEASIDIDGTRSGKNESATSDKVRPGDLSSLHPAS
jgi:hypothetical protein